LLAVFLKVLATSVATKDDANMPSDYLFVGCLTIAQCML
jgi:hypothetical protein